MMSTGSRSNALSFAMCFGFTEGKGHGKKLHKLLVKAGFKPAERDTDADIFIAHSAGCWHIPGEAEPRLVVYVGMPLSFENMISTWLKACWHDFREFVKFGFIMKGIRLFVHYNYYLFRRPRHNYLLAHKMRNHEPSIFADTPAVFIVNRLDPWPVTHKLFELVGDTNWTFVSMPGSHINIWKHPERYVAIIKHYADLLAKTDG